MAGGEASCLDQPRSEDHEEVLQCALFLGGKVESRFPKQAFGVFPSELPKEDESEQEETAI